MKSRPCSLQLEKACAQQQRPNAAKNKYIKKKNEIMLFAATWMTLEIIKLSEASQKEKDKYHLITLIRGI